MKRELWPSYLLVVGGVIAGLLVGGVLTSPEPAVLGWLLGAGAGLTGGAFVAAIVAGVPLGGRGPGARRRGGGSDGDGGGRDPLAYLGGGPATSATPAGPETPAAGDEAEQPEAVGLAGLGRRGNGRAL